MCGGMLQERGVGPTLLLEIVDVVGIDAMLSQLCCEGGMHVFVQQGVDKLLEHDSNARQGYSQTRSEAIAGCSERPSSKAAASEEAKRTLCGTLSL